MKHVNGSARGFLRLASLAFLIVLPLQLLITALPAMAAADQGLYAQLHTNRGVITARLHYTRAPITVMNFIGLAEGSTEWTASDGAARKEPLYRNLVFHRVRDFMVQTGDPTGTGKGDSGRIFDDEIDPTLDHSRPGMLSMANRGPNTNSSQFFITKQPAPWLDGRHTVFGEVVAGRDVMGRISEGDRLEKVVIVRRGEEARQFDAKRAHELSAARLARLREAARKVLPERIAAADPKKVPAANQPAVSPGDFDFLVIGHSGIEGLERLSRTFHYDHDSAMEVAKKLVQLARAPDADFPALIRRYSDMRRDTTTHGVRDDSTLPVGLKAIFRLKPGQVSDPVDLPTGIYIFRRLPGSSAASDR